MVGWRCFYQAGRCACQVLTSPTSCASGDINIFGTLNLVCMLRPISVYIPRVAASRDADRRTCEPAQCLVMRRSGDRHTTASGMASMHPGLACTELHG